MTTVERSRSPTAIAPDQPGHLGALARGGAANLAGSVVAAVAAFALTVLVAHSLRQAEAGVFFSTTSLFLLATTLGQLGTGTGVVYFISQARARGHPGMARVIVRTATRPVLVVGLVVGATGVAAASWIAALVLGADAGTATPYVRLLAVFVPIAGMEAVWLAGIRGFGSMRVNALVDLVLRPVLQLVLVVAVLPLHEPAWIALAWGGPYAVAALAAGLAWRRRRSQLPAVAAGSACTGFWRFTGPRAMTSIVQMVMQRFDVVLVGALAGAADAAIYAAATRLIVAGQTATSAFTQATQPLLGHALARGDHHEANEIYQLSTAWLVLLTWPLYLLLMIFRVPLLGIFGHGYDAGTGVLVWLSVSMIVAIGCGLVDVVLSMAGHTSWNLVNAGTALACNLGLDLWLIPRYGVLGAAIGWAIAIGVRNIAALVQVALALRLQPVAASTLLAGSISLTLFGALPLLVRAQLGDTWPALLTALGIGALLWLVAVVTLRRPLRLDAFGIRLPTLRDYLAARRSNHGNAR